MTTTSGSITWRKTQSGQWAVCGPAEQIRPGATVVVAKRSGGTSTVEIESVGKTFDRDGVPSRYGYPAERSSGGSAGSYGEDEQDNEGYWAAYVAGEESYVAPSCDDLAVIDQSTGDD